MRSDVPVGLAVAVAESPAYARAFLRGIVCVHTATIIASFLAINRHLPRIATVALVLMTAVGFVAAWVLLYTIPRSMGTGLDWSYRLWGARIPRVALRTLALPERYVHLRWITYGTLLQALISQSSRFVS